MAKLDKDRYLKELSINYCLASGLIPFLEVDVSSATNISDTIENLTDIDVLGITQVNDGIIHRTIFDCKSSVRMSPINRAFWAAGLRDYTGCDSAFVLLGNKAVTNHRLSALTIGIDLHDEESFLSLGKSLNPIFPANENYQASMDRWQTLEDIYLSNNWAKPIIEHIRQSVPLSNEPWTSFRRVISALRSVRGYIDPAKEAHRAIFFDVLAASFVLWIKIARDLRRIYDTKMSKKDFETHLRYYMWGGKESFLLRQQLAQRASTSSELPAWDSLVHFAGLTLDAPRSMFDCAFSCKELALRSATAADIALDGILAERLQHEGRTIQFSAALSAYLVKAANLPGDLQREIQDTLYGF